MPFHKTIYQLSAGLGVGNFRLYAKNPMPGVFEGEVNLNIFLRFGAEESNLLSFKIATNRANSELSWIEIFSIKDQFMLGNKTFMYFESAVETALLTLLGKSLGPGQDIFVEYDKDAETRTLLELNYPITVTRLGYKLLNLGFTWFKDLRFPNGRLEGNRTLQAKKPLNETARAREMNSIRAYIETFLENQSDFSNKDLNMRNAVQRAHLLANNSIESDEPPQVLIQGMFFE